MKLPSISSLAASVTNIFKRFPGAIILAAIGCIFSILINRLPYSQKEMHHWYWNMVMSCYLGMLLLITVRIFSEKKELSTIVKLMLQIAGLVIIAVYYFSLPDQFISVATIRFTLFAIGLHCLIAIVPFPINGEMKFFWWYNKTLFLRILAAFLYTIVLYIGLSLALLAMEKLFSIDINNKLYFDLWIVLMGFFNTCFFLAGFPEVNMTNQQTTVYPKGLKIFTQFVLIPILSIYLLILYAYLFKILLTWQWPVGWVSYLVLGFSIAGILSLLLIHPIRYEASNKWILTFSRFFYFALFPLLILLFFAIVRRIREYGITELRYFVLALAVWLLFIATYFLVSKQKNIKILPLSLCLLAFLTSFGFWSAFNVSLASQQNQLLKILNKNALIKNGKLIQSTSRIPFKDSKRICSIIEYIVTNHGYQILQPYYTQNLDSLLKDNLRSYQNTSKLLSLINIRYISTYQAEDNAGYDNQRFDYNVRETNDLLRVEGFDFFIKDYSYFYHAGKQQDQEYNTYRLNNDSVTVYLNRPKNILSVAVNKDSALVFDLAQMIQRTKSATGIENRDMEEQEMTLSASNNSYLSQLIITGIKGTEENNHIQITDLRAMILIGKKK